jgi:hypothetical protein
MQFGAVRELGRLGRFIHSESVIGKTSGNRLRRLVNTD